MPRSDVDLLVLHDGAPAREVAELAERLFYPLWDAGLTVGHAVRTIEECMEFAMGRLDALTAMLDARLLAGSAEPFERMMAQIHEWVREDPRGFAARLREAAAERRERYGSASYLLEPDVKEGAGGLRDIQSLGWLGAVVGEARGLPTLDGVGLLRTAEREAVDEAQEFLVRVRSAVHLETRHKSDRLLLEQQPQIARDMGFSDEPNLPAVDGLMRALFTHARQVEHVTGSVLERFLDLDTGDAPPMSTAEEVLEAFAAAAEDAVVLSPSSLDRIEAVTLPDPVPWSPEIRSAFLRILRSGEGGVRALEGMDRVELLERFLPEWGPVRCRPQRDPYHRFTADVHLLETLAGMGRLLASSGGEDPMAARAVELAGDHDALLLGALLHDIGKTGEGHHVEIGARLATTALERMRLDRGTRELAHFMVAEHLLLPDTATRRDLGDDDLVLDVAARIETPERLGALYLLAAADAGATGPHAWTPWRRTLVRELVAKVQRVLERGEMSSEGAERLEAQAGEIRARLEKEDGERVEAFLRRMPKAYLLSTEPELVAEHYSMLAAPVGSIEVRTRSGPGRRPGSYALTVVAADRPGLLSWIAGALSLAGLSILTAHVFTTEDEVALDVFEVEGWFESEVGEERWREFRASLRKTIEGRVSLEDRIQEKRRNYPPPRTPTQAAVTVSNEASDFFTVIEVSAPDRIGLLFDITRTLAELELDVHLAKVATYAERVIDAFYVRDTVGRRIEEPERVDEVRRRIIERVASEVDGEQSAV